MSDMETALAAHLSGKMFTFDYNAGRVFDQNNPDDPLPKRKSSTPELPPPVVTTNPTMTDILNAVAHVTGIPVKHIICKGRAYPVSRARHLFCWVARHATQQSLPAIARKINRDHSTIHNSFARVQSHIDDYRSDITSVCALIGIERP